MGGQVATLNRGATVLNLRRSGLGGSTADIPRTAESIYLSGLHGSVKDLPRDAKEVNLWDDDLTGELKDIPRSAIKMRFESDLSGHLCDLPREATSVKLLGLGANSVIGAFQDLPRKLTVLNASRASVHGAAADAPPGLKDCSMATCDLWDPCNDLQDYGVCERKCDIYDGSWQLFMQKDSFCI